MIKKAAIDLYGSYDKLPNASRDFIENALRIGDFESIYKRIRQMEAENKDVLLQFQEDYPGVMNTENVDHILETIRKKKENSGTP